jgi:hypothetical protein
LRQSGAHRVGRPERRRRRELRSARRGRRYAEERGRDGRQRFPHVQCGTLHIVFNAPNPEDKVNDAVDRIDRDMKRAAILDERNPEAVTYWRRKPQPKRMSAETVARLIAEFEERTGRTDHRVPSKKRGKRKHMTPGISNGMQPLTDPSASEQWPCDDEAGRHRIAWRLARKVHGDEASLVEHVVLHGAPPEDLARLRAALVKLAAHYRQFDLDDYITSERRKANEWLLSSSLCQQKPLLGWKTRRLSTACRSPR